MLVSLKENWLKVSLILIVLGLVIMVASYWASGDNTQLFEYHGVHDWFRTFYL
ncbi:hypothetical protein [Latilactobacillus fuchuensis]|jgi:hypothetical protein|uniref:Uncharacterized protein n=2 Tax=Latilactobacillus fuchuensis TaxID=164393 RepID=A0A2N9DUJ8_9LACO|nr:hypothetical protein [Latilactobacillus fuchuensis]KRL61537.1 hypothetical protein FC69_GL000755 [Latilactobacillus fuchuensis DSM 14340 = JCM 11249]MCP8857863.1 hypothetical protein [Latilactobacillus fuchuensis]SPC37729.1 conserved hypothetical protein [Latilactobacillus fuchuensis]